MMGTIYTQPMKKNHQNLHINEALPHLIDPRFARCLQFALGEIKYTACQILVVRVAPLNPPMGLEPWLFE